MRHLFDGLQETGHPAPDPQAPPQAGGLASPDSEAPSGEPAGHAIERGDALATPVQPPQWRRHVLRHLGDRPTLPGDDWAGRDAAEAVYVPLSTTWSSRGEQQWQGPGTRPKRRKLADLLTHPDHHYLLVKGGPGSGKSTFARASTVASLANPSQLTLYLELRDLGGWLANRPEDSASSLLDWAAAALEAHGLGESALKAWLGFGRTTWMLDGLDEITDVRLRVRAAALIERFAAQVTATRDRVIVTSRPHAVEDPAVRDALRVGGAAAEVAALNREEILDFLTRWYAARPQASRGSDPAHAAEQLFKHLLSAPQLLELSGSPLLLAVTAALYVQRGRLPERRVELLEWTTHALIDRRFGPGAGGSRARTAKVRQALMAISLRMMNQGALRTIGDGELRELIGQTWPPAPDAPRPDSVELELLAMNLESHSGLLVVEAHPPRCRFTHFVYQEFLAARAIAETEDPAAILRPRFGDVAWREVILMTTEYLGATHRTRLIGLVSALARWAGEEEDACGRLGLALHALLNTQLDILPPDELAYLCLAAASALDGRDSKSSALQRIELGILLGRIGDPRLGLSKETRWVHQAGGTFWEGSDTGRGSEKPRREARIEHPFFFGKYPITNAEFEGFVRAGGYKALGLRRWWSAEGREVWRAFTSDQAHPAMAFVLSKHPGQLSDKPYGWSNPRWDEPNQPVVGVSFYEAEAFCRWLNSCWEKQRPPWLAQGLEARLPNQWEWEVVAAGIAGRTYPWGDTPAPGPELANFSAQWGRTTPVGTFPEGATPEGVMDLAGNVWEWCQDRCVDPARPQAAQGAQTPAAAGESVLYGRVIRGGSWATDAHALRSCCQEAMSAGYRNLDVGFRIVLGLPGRSLPTPG